MTSADGDRGILPWASPASGWTNEQFLQAIFEDQWRRALICGFRGDPRAAGDAQWTAFPASMLPSREVQRHLNLYFCPSLVRARRRVLHEFESFHVLVVDDYGTKIAAGVPEAVLGTSPSYLIETSPGNHQAGWLMVEPVRDLGWVRGMLRDLRQAIGAADNLTDPVIWRRLPVGTNGKPANRGWKLRLRLPGMETGR